MSVRTVGRKNSSGRRSLRVKDEEKIMRVSGFL